MAEWLYEAGIGENRAILVEDGHNLEAVLELPAPFRAGAVMPARIARILAPGRRALVELEGGAEALMEPLPPGATEGKRLSVEVVREPLQEADRLKPAKVRATDAEPRPGPTLKDRIAAAEVSLYGSDRFEEAGWSELLEEARTGRIAFSGGSLILSLTPAMTVFDVDGVLPLPELARAGARAFAQAVRRHGIGGSIGVDLPTLAGKADRQAAAAEIDAVLPQPFERTGVNGFGFLQLVRRRERPSLPEIIQGDPVGAAARALLRKAERLGGKGALTIHAAPRVIARLTQQADWMDELARRTRAAITLRAEENTPMSAGHVQATIL